MSIEFSRVVRTLVAGLLFVPGNAVAERVSAVHVFTGPPDGANPVSGLISAGGKLYGTTTGGGNCPGFGGGCGTVFSLTKEGNEAIVYSFQGGTDGSSPNSMLLDVGGTLYGTTSGGGTYNMGTVFSVTPSGMETVLHSFQGGNDGVGPLSGLVDLNGVLYGTTSVGGANYVGTVFSVTLSGSETVLHSFSRTDGAFPRETLLQLNGTLYGTTISGSGGAPGGTVFSITPNGYFRVLHSFYNKGNDDGYSPICTLINIGNVLYGTTRESVVNRKVVRGGTVFSLTTKGNEAVLYRFSVKHDGEMPYGGVIDYNGDLFGTNSVGGQGHGGTVFEMTTSGSFIKSFSLYPNTATRGPTGSLLAVGHDLYGTTSAGSSNFGGVFKVRP